VIVTHTYSDYTEHPSEARLVRSAPSDGNQMQKVLPLSWFYGGKQPADNPTLASIYEAAKP